MTLYEYAGNLHMHTPYSDGEKYHASIAVDAIKAGLDFIVVTDHNIHVDGLEGYYETENGRVLLLVGEEVHNVRRKPQASHFLAYGVGRELFPCAANPQDLIDATNAAGGYGFLAHPHEKDVPIVGEANLGWHDWDIDGFTGLEIWNYMSSAKNRLADRLVKMWGWNKFIGYLYAAIPLALAPERYIDGPEPETLALWDTLLAQGKRIAAIGNADAHGTPMSVGPLTRIIYPYEYLFRAVNTHIVTHEPLNGDAAHDRRLILDAVGHGRGWVGYDLPHSTRGFAFSVSASEEGSLGDEVRLRAGATLQVRAPTKCNMRLVRHGEAVATAEDDMHLTYHATEPGAYRVECTLDFQGKQRGWIYSNPIYLRA